MLNKLREFRILMGYTIKEMADEIGVSKSYYEKIEMGIKEPSRNFIQHLKNRFPQFDTNIFFSIL